MDLKIKDLADLLNVSETTIRRWLAAGKIPAYRINHQYRFSLMEIEDWVMSHKLGLTGELSPFHPAEKQSKQSAAATGGVKQYCLFRAIHRGGVYAQVAGTDKETLIRQAMGQIAVPLNLDADVISDLLLDRESLQPTALNNGIAVPHTRDFMLKSSHDAVAVVFPKKPIAYGALDGQPVHTLFFLFASDEKRHLHLLAKIAHLSSQPQALSFFQTQPNKEKLLRYIKDWEQGILQADQVAEEIDSRR